MSFIEIRFLIKPVIQTPKTKAYVRSLNFVSVFTPIRKTRGV